MDVVLPGQGADGGSEGLRVATDRGEEFDPYPPTTDEPEET